MEQYFCHAAYLLCQALRARQPPLLVSDAIANRWLRECGGVREESQVENAGHLELLWGARIREHPQAWSMEAGDLSKWMLVSLGVSVPVIIIMLELVIVISIVHIKQGGHGSLLADELVC